jgi:hypothetical protein
MNRTLRRRHRRLWIAVAIVLLVGGWSAVRQRASTAPREVAVESTVRASAGADGVR